MVKPSQRMRKEFLLNKEKEKTREKTLEKKKKFKEAVFSNKKIPKSLISESNALFDEIVYNNDALNTVDDEYANVGLKDPKVLLTTSRDPSMKLRQFAKELKYVFPNTERINRGNAVHSQIIETAVTDGFTDVVFVHENKGVPSSIRIIHLPHGPTTVFSLHNVRLKHDQEDTETCIAYPHLVFDGFSTALGERVKCVLKSLFPVPKSASRRVVSFVNVDDVVSFRNHVYSKEESRVSVANVGPSFEMFLYEIISGVDGDKTAEREWVQRPYMNTSRKRTYL